MYVVICGSTDEGLALYTRKEQGEVRKFNLGELNAREPLSAYRAGHVGDSHASKAPTKKRRYGNPGRLGKLMSLGPVRFLPAFCSVSVRRFRCARKNSAMCRAVRPCFASRLTIQRAARSCFVAPCLSMQIGTP
jgi:hypothetical protein